MIPIHKHQEPRELVEYRATPNSTYEGMPGETKNIVKASLLQEQGNLCAYCMGRIGKENSSIEHWDAQTNQHGNDLNYSNMLAVCRKEGRPKSEQTCDISKNGFPIKFNPASSNESKLAIYYNEFDASIHSYDSVFDSQLKTVLNLNANFLKNNRKEAWEGVKKALNKKSPQQLLEKFRPDKFQNSNFKEYCGIILFHLKKLAKDKNH